MTVLKSLNCIFFALILISTPGFSQKSPTKTVDVSAPDTLFAVRNAIKIDPLQIIFGVYSLSYERIINSGFSAEVSVGITRRNYAVGWFDYSLDNLGQNVEIKTGYSYSASARKYFVSSAELYGPYLALAIRVKDYRTAFGVIDSTGTLTGAGFDEKRHFINYFLSIGYQALSLRSNIFADFYLGVSLQHEDSEIVKSDNIYNPDSYFISSKKTYGLGFQIGVKIGFGF